MVSLLIFQFLLTNWSPIFLPFAQEVKFVLFANGINRQHWKANLHEKVNLPSISVVVPTVVPSTTTEAPINASPILGSTTLPLILVWE